MTDYVLKFCFAGLALCAVIAIVIAGQAILSDGQAGKGVVEQASAKNEVAAIPAATTPAASGAAATTTASAFMRAAGSQTASIEAKDDAPALSSAVDIFGSVPRKVTTVPVGADGKLATAP